MYNITNYNESVFESIKHIDENGCEYWYARELGKVLDYSEYRKFLPIIKKAITIVMKVLVTISARWPLWLLLDQMLKEN